MRVIDKSITELVPYAANPRKNKAAVPFVANSIREFGFKVPIVIDSHNVIVAGHTRYQASNIMESSIYRLEMMKDKQTCDKIGHR